MKYIYYLPTDLPLLLTPTQILYLMRYPDLKTML